MPEVRWTTECDIYCYIDGDLKCVKTTYENLEITYPLNSCIKDVTAQG